MMPTDQGLDADQPPTRNLDLRLIVQNELLALHRVPEFPLERFLMLELHIELFLEQSVATTAGGLGLVQGEVCVLQQLLDLDAVPREERHADTRADDHLLVMDLKGLIDRLDQALAQEIGLSGAMRAHLHHGELVAAEPGTGIRLANAGGDPLGHRDQEIVAREVAERIVDVLEVVEIDQQQGDRLVASAGLGDSVLQAVVQQDPIGQPGQRVVMRHVVNLLLGSLALGYVVEHPDETIGRALGSRHHRGGKQDRAPITGTGAQPGLDAFAVRRCDARRVRVLQRG